jgi:hypothetical protein
MNAISYRRNPYSLLVIMAVAGLAAGCSSSGDGSTGGNGTGGGGGGGGGTGPTRVTLPLGTTLQGVAVTANQPTQVVFTHSLPPGVVTSWRPDLSATMQHLRLSVTPPTTFRGAMDMVAAALTGTVSVTARIAAADQRETVCTSGVSYGPFSMTLTDAFLPSVVAPASA